MPRGGPAAERPRTDLDEQRWGRVPPPHRITALLRPQQHRVDNGPEFISKALDRWAYENRVTLDFSRPGKPTDNAFVESFNGRFRAECLDIHWFLSLADAREKIAAWRQEYNGTRPHTSLSFRSPSDYARQLGLSAIP